MKNYLCPLALALHSVVGCGAVESASSDASGAAAVETEAVAAVTFDTTLVEDITFSTELPQPTRDEAEKAAAAFLVDIEQLNVADCARAFNVPESDVFGRFVGCRSGANDAGPSGWEPFIQCDLGLCARSRLDDAEIVPFDGRLALATRSGNPLTVGERVILRVDLQAARALVGDTSPRPGSGGVVATQAHLFVRTRAGRFSEAPVPKSTYLPAFDPFATTFVLPSGSDRVELFLRFERSEYRSRFTEDGSYEFVLAKPTSDGYVSNSGENFSLPVAAEN